MGFFVIVNKFLFIVEYKSGTDRALLPDNL